MADYGYLQCMGYDAPTGLTDLFGTLFFAPSLPTKKPVALWSPPVKIDKVTKITMGGVEIVPVDGKFSAPQGRVTIEISGEIVHGDYTEIVIFTVNYLPFCTGIVGIPYSRYTAIRDSKSLYIGLYDQSNLLWNYPWNSLYEFRDIIELRVTLTGDVYVSWIDSRTLIAGVSLIRTPDTLIPEFVWDMEILNFNPWQTTMGWSLIGEIVVRTGWSGDFQWSDALKAWAGGGISATVDRDLQFNMPYSFSNLNATKMAFIIGRHPDFDFNVLDIGYYEFTDPTFYMKTKVDIQALSPIPYPRQMGTSVRLRAEIDLTDTMSSINSESKFILHFDPSLLGGTDTNTDLCIYDILSYRPVLIYDPNIRIFFLKDGTGIGAMCKRYDRNTLVHFIPFDATGPVEPELYSELRIDVKSDGTIWVLDGGTDVWDGTKWIRVGDTWRQISTTEDLGGVDLANSTFTGLDYTIEGTEILKSTPAPANTEFIGIAPTVVSGSGVKIPSPPANTSFGGPAVFVFTCIEANPANTSFEGINAVISSFVNSPPANTNFWMGDLTVQEFIGIYDKLSVKGIPANTDHGAIDLSYVIVAPEVTVIELGKSINGKVSNVTFEGIPGLFYCVKGIVLVNGVVAQRVVRVYSSITGNKLGETTSDSLGHFTISNLPFTEGRVFLVSLDPNEDPVVVEGIIPGLSI